MARLAALLFSLWTLLPIAASAETYLLMAEQKGCQWCELWNAEISHIYPKTAEGRTAPLRRYDIRAATPDAELNAKVMFTPTFILVKDHKEVGRIEGYPGEDFFWGQLKQLLDEAEIPLDQSG